MNRKYQKNNILFLASVIGCRLNFVKKKIKKIKIKLKIECYVNIKIIKMKLNKEIKCHLMLICKIRKIK